MTLNRPRARRLSPDARRQSIVDAAVALIIETGHPGCTLERVAQRAGISTALIYKYFPRREELLRAILDSEFKALGGRGLDAIPDDLSIERVIRSTVERALRYYHDHGPILRLLMSDPTVARFTRTRNRASRSDTTDYFVKRLRREFRVPNDVAVIAVTMVVNAPILSMRYLRGRKVDVERTVDVWTEFILGGWRALQRRYGAAAHGSATTAKKSAATKKAKAT